MGSLPPQLAAELRDRLGLTRAIETGTFLGGGTRLLAGIFPTVVTIELAAPLAERARAELADLTDVTVRQGNSRTILPELIDAERPTLYWLDGHWSGGETAGSDDECPVMDEVAAVAAGNERDCILIDDARLFAASPPPPHDPDAWPTLVELFDALRRARPGHHVTVLRDLVIAVPAQARDLVDAFGREQPEPEAPAQPSALDRLLSRVKR
jgi:hypothetical protein